MPNIVGVTELNGPINLLTVLLGDRSTVTLTRAEAQAYIDQHSSFSDTQLENQFINLITGRWINRTDTVAVHLLARSPVAITVWLGQPGTPIPPNWWLI